MDSIITKISPISTKVNTSPEITIIGDHFTDGGDPVAFIDDVEVDITAFTNTEIKLNIPKSLPIGNYRLVILNGEEQP